MASCEHKHKCTDKNHEGPRVYTHFVESCYEEYATQCTTCWKYDLDQFGETADSPSDADPGL